MKKLLSFLIVGVAVVIGGVAFSLLWPSIIQKGQLNKPIGGEKDERGCLVAAGYSWCEAKQKCLRIWEEGCGKTSQPACRDDIPQDKETCEAEAGAWGRLGLSQDERCNPATSDAGKTCSNQNECEGACLADLTQEEQNRIIDQKEIVETDGRCTSRLLIYGCNAYVNDGQVDGILCVD